jgi:hypothetical protein
VCGFQFLGEDADEQRGTVATVTRLDVRRASVGDGVLAARSLSDAK